MHPSKPRASNLLMSEANPCYKQGPTETAGRVVIASLRAEAAEASRVGLGTKC